MNTDYSSDVFLSQLPRHFNQKEYTLGRTSTWLFHKRVFKAHAEEPEREFKLTFQYQYLS